MVSEQLALWAPAGCPWTPPLRAPAEGRLGPMSPGLPRPTESLPGVAVGGYTEGAPAQDAHLTHRGPGGWPLFLSWL